PGISIPSGCEAVQVRRIVSLSVLLAGLLHSEPCFGITSLDFDRGNGTAFTDQYTGAIGGGWTTPWIVSSGTTGAPTVIDANPLALEGGNYLSVSGLTGINRNVIRQYGNTPDFGVNSPHTIS